MASVRPKTVATTILSVVGVFWLVTITSLICDHREGIAMGDATAVSSMQSRQTADLRKGLAYAPPHAPEPVHRVIWAANALTEKPYKANGGRETLWDTGYDGAGAISMALHYAGILDRPFSPDKFMSFGEPGPGEWITIYARRDEAFAVIAGLRFDTTDLRLGGHSHPMWHTDDRPLRGFVARHPSGL